jgi:hypothetical protein
MISRSSLPGFVPEIPSGNVSVNENNTENESSIVKKSMSWSADNEEILVEWGDTAQCYKWLHTESHLRYANQHAWFTIPTIVFSTAAGTASFAQTSFTSLSSQYYASIVTGTVNIMVGILSTVQEYLKVSEYKESHRVAYLYWDKFARNIRVELAKTPMERSDAHHFIKVCRLEYDRLMETSPAVAPNIVKKFLDTFSGKKGSFERTLFNNLKKPDICNSIVSINDTRRKWFDSNVPRRVSIVNQLTPNVVLPSMRTSPFMEKKKTYIKKVSNLFKFPSNFQGSHNGGNGSNMSLYDEKDDDLYMGDVLNKSRSRSAVFNGFDA